VIVVGVVVLVLVLAVERFVWAVQPGPRSECYVVRTPTTAPVTARQASSRS
jgi:hypothetical protein